MAHLLGSKSCIQSLRQDVLDLHTTISDATSNAGAVKVASWKYPDKLAGDLDILELLKDHEYMPEETEDNQVSHIVMYELVIDRLVYLLHLATNFVTQSLEVALPENSSLALSRTGSANSTGSRLHSMSTGILVKKLWSRLSAFNEAFLETQEKNLDLASNVEALEEALEKVTLDYLEVTQKGDPAGFKSSQIQPLVPRLDSVGAKSVPIIHTQSRDSNSVSCQTLETAFTACNNCSLFQRDLFSICDSINLVCQNLGVRCSTSKLLSAKPQESIQSGTLSVQDVDRLCSELSKDLNCVLKKCQDHNNKLEKFASLTSELQKETDALKEKLSKSDSVMKIEREKSQAKIDSLNSKLSDLRSDSESKIADLSETLETLQSSESSLRSEISEIQKDRKNYIEQVENLKHDNQLLEDKCETLAKKVEESENEIAEKSEKVEVYEREIEKLRLEIDNSEQMLKKEKVKNKITNNRDEEMMSKQEVLVKRLEELDEQCENLKQELSELEIERDEVKEELIESKKSLVPLQTKVAEQETLIKNLESENNLVSEQIQSYEEELRILHKEVESLKEKQDLLILFPDLTEVDSRPTSKAPEGLDENDPKYLKYEMEQQIYSNTLRISKLDDLNNSLRNSLAKIEVMIPKGERSSNGTVEPNSHNVQVKNPVQLLHSAQREYYKQESNEALGVKDAKSKWSSSSLSEKQNSMSPSKEVKQKTAVKSSNSIAVDHENKPGRPKSGKTERWASSSSVRGSNSFACNKCVRSFKSNHELQMHSNFCS